MATDPSTAAQDWVNGLSAKTAKITQSVQSVTVAPGQAAARQKAVWMQNTQAAADKWANASQRVTLAEWQSAMVNKGIPRIASGAQAAQSKMQAVFAQLLPYIDSAKQSLPPRGTFEQNKARATAMMDKMHAFPGIK